MYPATLSHPLFPPPQPPTPNLSHTRTPMSGMSTYDFTNLFGETLVSSSKGEKTERNTASSLNGKNILIYFSAHW